ncbi:tensin-2-like [Thalassophryne amazonica]|uniref:tensin-2-like n=1 Tax=Thalassophryne amazonica TaxID=390379 RepID=UPI001470F74F|nr:tensin-2-like [Thalassophryne amazonica]
MGCIQGTMKKHTAGTNAGGIPVKTELEVHPEILQLTELSKVGGHKFIEKSSRKKRVCDVCKLHSDNPLVFCKECKIAVHKTCEAKVSYIITP